MPEPMTLVYRDRGPDESERMVYWSSSPIHMAPLHVHREEHGPERLVIRCCEDSLYADLRRWLEDRNRKPPDLAFTAGPVRDAAQAVWDSGVLDANNGQ